MSTKEEILEVKALRVYNSRDTLIITFSPEMAAGVAAKHDAWSKDTAVIDEVDGYRVSEWEESERVRRRFMFIPEDINRQFAAGLSAMFEEIRDTIGIPLLLAARPPNGRQD